MKKVIVEGRHYIVCRISRQQRKDTAAWEAMVDALEERLRSNPKGLVGNRGYVWYPDQQGAMSIDRQKLEWSEIKRDLKALQRITEEENGRRLAVRTACAEACGKIFQAVGVALPPTIGHLEKLLFCPISALCLKIYPRNINYMPVVNFVARLDLDPNI